MMNRYLVALMLVFSVACFSGCRALREAPAQRELTTESGLKVKVTRKGSGSMVRYGNLVRFHYTAELEDGRVFDDSRERNGPATVRVGNTQLIPGLSEGISLLRVGDRATLVIPADLAYGEQGYGPVPPDATLTYYVEIIEIVAEQETAAVEELERVRTESGLEFAILERGGGPALHPGMVVRVHYTGFFEDGSVFDSSLQRGEPFSFILGRKMVIAGWEESFLHLRAGDKARLYIPYHLAYGLQGRGRIPGGADLVFDVEILEAKQPDRPIPFETGQIQPLETESGLQLFIIEEGKGEHPVPGNVITLHYSGYLVDGTLFDSSVQRGEVFRFVLGGGQVIPGWDEGIALLRPGSRARLLIPPHLGYGRHGRGPIPPDASLYFDLEIIAIE
jgi:peptidylprolyl isomerase